MARPQAVNQQKKAVAASNTTAAKRSPVKPKVTSDRATKKAKLIPALATDRDRSPEKEIGAGKAGKEIATGTGIAAEPELLSGTDSTLALDDFLMEMEVHENNDAPTNINQETEIPTEKEGSSCRLGKNTYNFRTRPEKQIHMDESDSEDEDEDNDDNEENSADEVPKKPDATPPKIHQNVARLKGSGSRGRPIVPVSPSGTIELSL
jgi:hypothetical protein